MADLSAIRTGLAARFATIATFRHAYDVWPDQVNTPCAIVMPAQSSPAAWREALGGAPSFTFEVTILMCPWADRGLPRAQRALDEVLDDTGASSVHAAIRSDRTLGGTVHTCDVAGFTEYGALEMVNGTVYLGCKLLVTVWA